MCVCVHVHLGVGVCACDVIVIDVCLEWLYEFACVSLHFCKQAMMIIL